MATATSSRGARHSRRTIGSAAVVLVAILVAVAVAAAQRSSDPTRAADRSPDVPTAFAWLHPSAAPASWRLASTPSRATLAYPPGWHTIQTDAGTVSAAPRGRRGVFSGYLNATPQGGPETLANWRHFRVVHVASEGAHDVRLAAAATGLHFRTGRGSCVIDSYSTDKARFREIACIVQGARSTAVVVAAAPAAGWARVAPSLERAVASFDA
jgi:hypothetical protein